MSQALLYGNAFTDVAAEADFASEGGGSFTVADGGLLLDDSVSQSGLTVWLKQEFDGDLLISYEAEVLEPELANNLNLFFMSKTLGGAPVLSEEHSGRYPEYHDTCRMYIFTMTGEMAGSKDLTGWSRLRKNPGFLLLSEDAGEKTRLGETYRFEFRIQGHEIRCSVNGRTVHAYTDPDRYEGGAIGFRTWRTRLTIRNFQVFSI